MPYQVYVKSTGERFGAIPLGQAQEHWLFHDNDITKEGQYVTSLQGLTALGATAVTEQELGQKATLRQARGRELQRRDRQRAQFQPLSLKEVIYILEAEYLEAKAARDIAGVGANNQLITREGVASGKLLRFIRRQRGDAAVDVAQDAFVYRLEASFVGETAHVHASHILNQTQPTRTVRYNCVAPNARFTAFLTPVQASAAAQNAAKTDMNEMLVAPRTIGDATAQHQRVLRSFLSGLGAQRRRALEAWVQQRFAGHGNVRRAGIWIRRVPQQDGHTTDQNMSQERFRKILDACHAAGIQELILLGDGCANGQTQTMWLNHPVGHPHYTANDVHDFTRIWDAAHVHQGAPAYPAGPQGAAPGVTRGYAEQVCIYTALYRGQNLQNVVTHTNMECIITNKSGGPDLPSLAGVPQIQIAEMAQNEVLIHHRMGFQALCSPMWSVVRAFRGNGPMTLSDDERDKLTEFIRRAQPVRNWHLAKLGSARFTWTAL